MLTNCAMMGVDWRDLTFWQYQALLATWNDRHSSDGGKAPPDPEKLERLKRSMAAVSVH